VSRGNTRVLCRGNGGSAAGAGGGCVIVWWWGGGRIDSEWELRGM
jgi:hypothetical protein